jgi:hypothetical protein
MPASMSLPVTAALVIDVSLTCDIESSEYLKPGNNRWSIIYILLVGCFRSVFELKSVGGQLPTALQRSFLANLAMVTMSG